MRNDYPECSRCGCEMFPVWFVDKEYDCYNLPTGRTRCACSHFECPLCFKVECVDDSFDGPWRYGG